MNSLPKTVTRQRRGQGSQRHWNIGGSQVERRRRENRGAVGGEEWGLGRGCAPSQKTDEFFFSKWCDMVHSGCVIFKIRELKTVHWAHCR